jgi:exodeoxyribonuclease VII large subunit
MDQVEKNRFGYQFGIKLFKAKMQGNDAADSIIQALHQIFDLQEQGDYFDCAVIIRGGGAQVDLDCFDNYDVAAHVAQFPLPVITGIGHDRDETVLDLIAHTKKKTPTAVAEFLVEKLQVFENQLDEQAYRLSQFTRGVIDKQRSELDQLNSAIKLSVVSNLIHYKHQLGQLQERFMTATRLTFQTERQKIDDLGVSLKKGSMELIQDEQRYLSDVNRLMQMVDPSSLLKLGFSITYVNGKTLTAAVSPKVGDKLLTKTATASYLSSLEETIPPNNASKKDE